MTYREKYNVDDILEGVKEIHPDFEDFISKCKLLKEYFDAKDFYEGLLKVLILKDVEKEEVEKE